MEGKHIASRLSPKQQQVLEFIIGFMDQRGYAPSVREIGAGVGLRSPATVYAHLRNLEKKGCIQRDPTKPRTIEVIAVPQGLAPPGPRSQSLPVLGRVTAGAPLLAVENMEGYLPMARELVSSPESAFFLRVRGDSMVNAGILEGDLVLVTMGIEPQNGDIVVALVHEEEATVKRFYREANQVRLQPENPLYEPIITASVRILGKVTAVLRFI